MNTVERLVFERLELQHERWPGAYMLVSKAWLCESRHLLSDSTLHRIFVAIPRVKMKLWRPRPDDSIDVSLRVMKVKVAGHICGLPAKLKKLPGQEASECEVWIDQYEDLAQVLQRVVKVKDIALVWGYRLFLYVNNKRQVQFFDKLFEMDTPFRSDYHVDQDDIVVVVA